MSLAPAGQGAVESGVRQTPFELIGGEQGLRPLVERFVERVFADVMIGFLFRNADKTRVAAKELELAARHLGADVPYTGKPLREAHAPHPISAGHFDRRKKILEEVLLEAGVDARVRETWLDHVERLRGTIVLESGPRCNPGAPPTG